MWPAVDPGASHPVWLGQHRGGRSPAGLVLPDGAGIPAPQTSDHLSLATDEAEVHLSALLGFRAVSLLFTGLLVCGTQYASVQGRLQYFVFSI